ncbi:MAG: hypothetical protein ACP5QK_02760 [Myxococcota bacterium]
MKGKELDILEEVYRRFRDHWDESIAIDYVPKIFPFVRPQKKIRDAMKALNCKRAKDIRFRDSIRSVEIDRDYHSLIRELEQMLERQSMRSVNEKRNPEYRDIFLSLIPILVSQRNNAGITLNINSLDQTIYGECEKCPIREICKEAFAKVTEYMSYALKELNLQISRKTHL